LQFGAAQTTFSAGRSEVGVAARHMKRAFYLVIGWLLLIGGIIITPMPIPIPLIGVVPFLVGCAILSKHSKVFRRFLQYMRHRFEWFSKTIESTAHRMPLMVKHMIHRTNPKAHVRRLRMRSRRKD
jgi:uncharacterized membrane protein YbaN (DUF454 family)